MKLTAKQKKAEVRLWSIVADAPMDRKTRIALTDSGKVVHKSNGKPLKVKAKQSELLADAKRKAKKVGKRKSASGKTYYESRPNRSDKKKSL
jgi:hypothetical protein